MKRRPSFILGTNRHDKLHLAVVPPGSEPEDAAEEAGFEMWTCRTLAEVAAYVRWILAELPPETRAECGALGSSQDLQEERGRLRGF